MRTAPRRGGGRRESGFALIVVLLVLLALLVLAGPFLLMARNADKSSTQLADRADARLALDSAARHGRHLLGESHPGLDTTPYFDSLEEVAVDNRFDPAFLDASDPTATMWDLDRQDVAGFVDLSSAPPQMIANLMGASTRFSKAIAADEKELPLSSAAGLEPKGFLVVGAEIIRYTKIEDTLVTEFKRGVLSPAKGTEWHGGPKPPSPHAAGAPVIDQRAFAPAQWRLRTADGELRPFESAEQLSEASGFVLEAALADEGEIALHGPPVGLSEDALRPLALYGTAHGGVRAGRTWQRAARLASAVKGGEDGRLRIDNVRWVNPGSTIQITDGASTELAIVLEVERDGTIVLDRILESSYEPYAAIVRVLARRPVNLNTAPPEVLKALFSNLQINGRNSRITRDEAQQLAELVVQSRPFTGFEDFLRRVVLPAAGLEKLPEDAEPKPDALAGGSGFIDALDALALYRNGLNANDGKLLYSTMPYSFVTRDVYDLELRATVNAPSGVERFSAVRDQTEVVVPQREMLALWARQEDFDESLRLDCDAPWWMTGPSATSRFDDGAAPPSRIWAHMGTYEGEAYLPGVTSSTAAQTSESPPSPEHVFASREEAGWIQLWPSRVEESSDRLRGRVMHFDHETRDPEGRYLPDQTVTRTTDDKQLAWTGATAPLCRPLALSLWIKPRARSLSTYLDVGGTSKQTDRISLLEDDRDLVLQVLDGVGDHPATTDREVAEVRFQLAPGPGPGLPVDVWSHVELDVRGNRPDQMSVLVNGLAQGVRTPGLTRLSAGASQTSPTLAVESVEGFPAHCCVRVGNELIEVTVGTGVLDAARQEAGEWAGFGGRVARDEWTDVSGPDWPNHVTVAASLATTTVDHASGTPVELYGYSLPLLSDVPTGAATLTADMGPFRVARLAGVVGGLQADGDPIAPEGAFGLWGFGMEGASSQVTGLVLASADEAVGAGSIPAAQYMSAFHSDGGYAAIVHQSWSLTGSQARTIQGTPIGGIEVVRYTGWTGNILNLAARGDAVSELSNLQAPPQAIANLLGGRRAFIAKWQPPVVLTPPIENLLDWQTFVVPISLSVRGASAVNGYLAAKSQDSRFAQITHLTDAENTEWVRYDWFEAQFAQLVRDDPETLKRVYDMVTSRGTGVLTPPTQPPAPGIAPLVLEAAPPPVVAAAPAQTYGSQWDPRLGKSESPAATYPISEAVSSTFQFRGVFGTFAHTHKSGTPILPVFMTVEQNADGGRPGRMDAAFLVGDRFDHPGWPVRVHRAHVPSVATGWLRWQQNASTGMPEPVFPPAGQNLLPQDAYVMNKTYVALQDRSPEVMVAGSLGSSSGTTVVDSRAYARLTCFPSGERPRIITRAAIGGGFDGPSSGAVPSAAVDEVVFGDAQFARGMPGVDPESTAGASLVLQTELDEEGLQLEVAPKSVRLAIGDVSAAYEFLTESPQDAGLLRIGDEIMAYNQRDTATGSVSIANAGRGLLGTRAQPHHTTEPVLFLEHRAVTFLAGAVSASDGTLPVADIADFPAEGTVIVGTELIHYTRLRSGALEMPRASAEPGLMDNRGGGLFRGRFGTTPAGHSAGEPVILFPFRYWDRWAPKADAPELAYFGLQLDQPSAFFSSCFFLKDDVGEAQVGVLQRTDPAAPWDADPESDKRLSIHEKGDVEGAPIPIGAQSDRVEWRVFVRWAPGAFDATTGLPHGWKQTPRLRRFGSFYFGPGVVLGSVER